MKSSRKVTAFFAVLLIMITSVALVSAPIDGFETTGGPPTRADIRTFLGYIGNLTPTNYQDVNLSNVLVVAGSDNSQPPQIIGPYNATFDNLSTMEFSVGVDITNHNTLAAWDFTMADRYGYNATNGGKVLIPHPAEWSDITNITYFVPNGTLEYTPGVFGSISLSVYNGSSGEPLEGVGFRFPRHIPFDTSESGLLTDENGDVTFNGLQLGRDRDNKVEIEFLKDNFNTYDGSGKLTFPLHKGTTTHYDVTLRENDLVNLFAPADNAVNISTKKDIVNIFIRFHYPMNKSSVNTNTVYLEEIGTGKVDITYRWDVEGRSVNLEPAENLKFNTSYKMVVKPRVLNITDVENLWRTFESTFTTYLKDPRVFGTVYIQGTTDPAPEGTEIQLDNNPRVELNNGQFDFPSVKEDITHTLTVYGPSVGGVSEYMYYGNLADPYPFSIGRGMEKEINDIFVTKRDTRNVIFNVVDEGGAPLEGVTLLNQITKEEFLTDNVGQVEVEDIRTDLTTPFKASLLNFFDQTFSIYASTEDPTYKNITLLELELPVEVKARGEYDVPLTVGVVSIIDVDSYIIMDFENDMDTETMTTDNVQILGPGSSPITVDVKNETGSFKRWKVIPRNDLLYNTQYTLLVTESIAEVGGNNPFWKDLRITFKTQSLDSAAINGRVAVRGKGVEGIPVEVIYNGNVIAEGESGVNGFFLLDIEMNVFQISPITILANGSYLGLTTQEITPRTLTSGGALNNTDFELERLPDWFSVIYPKDEHDRMLVTGTITLKFKEALRHDDLPSFMENFTLGSPRVDVEITISEDGKTVTVNPRDDLDYDSSYLLSISDFTEGEFYRELLTVTGTNALIRGEVLELITEYKPIEALLQSPSRDSLSDVPIGTDIIIYFTNYTVNRDLIEDNIQIVAVDNESDVTGITFSWSANGRTLTITHDDFEGLTEYMIQLLAGSYGTNGETMRKDLLVYFTTRVVEDPTLIPISELPIKPQKAGPITVTASNPRGTPIRVAVMIIPADNPNANWSLINNFTLAALEERQVTLDFTGREDGEYSVLIRVFDGSKPVVINEYFKNIVIGEETEPDEGVDLFIIIVIVVVVLVLIGLGVFLYMQTRKKDIEEELKEEFECPECHNLVGSDDTVCPHCGAEFEEEAYKCPKCGNVLDPEDDECGECGYDFSDQDKMELEDDEDEDIEMEDEDEDSMEIDEDEDVDFEDEEEEEEEMEEIEEED
ncbi:MAG: Ig-like domain-containing protein [Thermoplasmatota archaeon]